MNTKTTHPHLRSRTNRALSFLANLFLALGFIFGSSPALGQSEADVAIPPEVVPTSPDPNLGSDEVLPNMSSALSRIYTGWQSGELASELLSESQGLEITDDRVFVTLIMLDKPSAQEAIATLPGLGAEVTSEFETWIDAWVPISKLEKVASLPGISQVREVIKVFHIDTPLESDQIEESLSNQEIAAPESGSFTTQGVVASSANIWHNKGWTGQGVKVAVIDTFKWYKTAVTNGELPNNIKEYSTLANPINLDGGPTGHHGTACAEIIYDMAPGVQFTFATPYTAVSMANLIIELAQQGNKIISSSYGWSGYEPGDGTGPLNTAIKNAYLTYGTLYVQAAGNMRQFHWDGKFSDTNNDLWHEFTPGLAINWFDPNLSTSALEEVAANTRLDMYLRWNSWWYTSIDYDLHLVRWNAATQQADIVASSKIRQDGTKWPRETFVYIVPQNGYYGIAIQRWSATGAEVLDLGGYGLPPFSINVPARSLIDAGNSPYALTVSAIDVLSYKQESYSSQGPTHGAGGGLGAGYSKPNLAAFANVDTWAWSNMGQKFAGTSAATPHIAGAAALVWQAYPSSHAYHIWTHLSGFAIDLGTAGYDYIFGNGALKMWTNPPSNTSSQAPPSQCATCAPGVNYNQYVPLIIK